MAGGSHWILSGDCGERKRTRKMEVATVAVRISSGGKAQFFVGLGFTVSDPAVLAEALRRVGIAGTVVLQATPSHGAKFVVDGALQSPSGQDPIVRTVWIIDTGEDVPRLITAYPGGR